MMDPDAATSSTRRSAIRGSLPALRLVNDILKCALKPVLAEDYKRPLSGEQLNRLKAAFPQGVCDSSRPGEEQAGMPEPWLKY